MQASKLWNTVTSYRNVGKPPNLELASFHKPSSHSSEELNEEKCLLSTCAFMHTVFGGQIHTMYMFRKLRFLALLVPR